MICKYTRRGRSVDGYNFPVVNDDSVGGDRLGAISTQSYVTNEIDRSVAAACVEMDKVIRVHRAAANVQRAVCAERADFYCVGAECRIIKRNQTRSAVVLDIDGA